MPNKKISQFNSVTSLTGSELIPIVQAGINMKCTVDDIRKTVDKDHGRIFLPANATTHVPFSKTLSSIAYNLRKYAYQSDGNEVLVKITLRTNTGFYAWSVVNCTLEWDVYIR